VAQHAAVCDACREELARLRVTHAALLSVRDEEVPRRIAFVSDKVFEPTWWQRLWRSAPRLGFASAAMLSAAILVHAFTRPAPNFPTPSLDSAAIRQIVEREVAARLDTSVEAAVVAADARNAETTAQLLAAAERRLDEQRRIDRVSLEEAFAYQMKQLNVLRLVSANLSMERR